MGLCDITFRDKLWYPHFLPFHVIFVRALVAGENAPKYYFIAPTPTLIIEQEYVDLSHP